MLFPEQPYTRYRFQTLSLGINPSYAYVNTQYAGTPSDPWKVASTTNYSGSQQAYMSETMHDVETPEYLKEWAKGIATVNPMEQTQKSYIRGTGYYFVKRINRSSSQPYYYTGGQSYGTNGIGDNHLTTSWNYPSENIAVDDSIIAEAIQEAWSKVSLQDTMALATAAELNKTLDFLLSSIRRVWKIYRTLRRFDLKALKGEIKPKELAQRYMEARYALRPIAYDIRNTLEATANKVPAKYTTFRGFKADIASNTYTDFVCREVSGDYRLTGTATAERSLEVRSGVLTMVTGFNAFARWGCGDILQTTWELVPFSFIVDWFFQVGKLIASWAPKIGLKTLASWYVVDDTTTLSVTAETGTSLASGYNYINTYNRQGTYSKVLRTKYRIPNPDRPILPSCNVRLNNLKLLDLSIIATGLYNSWFNRKGFKTRPKTNYGYAFYDD